MADAGSLQTQAKLGASAWNSFGAYVTSCPVCSSKPSPSSCKRGGRWDTAAVENRNNIRLPQPLVIAVCTARSLAPTLAFPLIRVRSGSGAHNQPWLEPVFNIHAAAGPALSFTPR